MTQRRRLRYVGWDGKGNIGDDAIRMAWELALPDCDLTAADDGDVDGILVGGGTLLLRPDWAWAFSRIAASHPGKPWWTSGIGVEDPAFATASGAASSHDYWASFVAGFRVLSTRSELSSQRLRSVGIEVETSADPALALPQPVGVPRVPRRVVINVGDGFAGGTYGASSRYEHELSITVETLLADGYDVVMVALSLAESEACERVAQGRCPVQVAETTEDVLRLFASAVVVIGTRLHALYLAAVSRTPMVAIAYQPKCFDAVTSLACERVATTGDVASGFLCAAVADILEGWPTEAEQLATVLGTQAELARAGMLTVATDIDHWLCARA